MSHLVQYSLTWKERELSPSWGHRPPGHWPYGTVACDGMPGSVGIPPKTKQSALSASFSLAKEGRECGRSTCPGSQWKRKFQCLSMVLNATKGAKIIKTKRRSLNHMTVTQSLLNSIRSTSESDESKMWLARGQGVNEIPNKNRKENENN